MNKSLFAQVSTFIITLGFVTVSVAAPVTYRFTGQIDFVPGPSDSPAMVGDSWIALFTFDDSDLNSGTTLKAHNVLDWQLILPTDPYFNLSKSNGDILAAFEGVYDESLSGTDAITFYSLIALAPTTQGFPDWFNLDNDLILEGIERWYRDDGAFDGSILGTVVPIPAAVWLFGSGLLGLFGMARRRREGVFGANRQ